MSTTLPVTLLPLFSVVVDCLFASRLTSWWVCLITRIMISLSAPATGQRLRDITHSEGISQSRPPPMDTSSSYALLRSRKGVFNVSSCSNLCFHSLVFYRKVNNTPRSSSLGVSTSYPSSSRDLAANPIYYHSFKSVSRDHSNHLNCPRIYLRFDPRSLGLGRSEMSCSLSY